MPFDAPPTGTVYRGFPPTDAPGPGRVVVLRNGDEHDLNPRFDVRNHSPDGFMWGYGGSGPAQTALAILSDAIGVDAATARETHYQDFKFAFVAKWPSDRPWQISIEEIQQWVKERQQ